jgi:hypothetical protein
MTVTLYYDYIHEKCSCKKLSLLISFVNMIIKTKRFQKSLWVSVLKNITSFHIFPIGLYWWHVMASTQFSYLCVPVIYGWFSVMSMGREYVSEPRPPTGLLLIPKVVCEHGEPWWWWCLLRRRTDSSTRALWQSYQQSHLGASRRNGQRSEKFATSIWNTSRDF